MPYEDDENDVVAPPMDDEEGQGPESLPPVAPPSSLESAVLPPRPYMSMPPRGTGYTYATPGPGDFSTTQQAGVPWGGSVTLPGNAQNFAAMQSPVEAPGSSGEYWQRFQQAYRNLPLEQAQQAISAAVKYQGMRGYQRDIESGNVTAEQALAKWAPMIFVDQKGGSSAMPKPNYQFVPGQGGAPATFQAPGARPVIVPQNALPGTMFTPSITDLGNGVKVVNLGPNHSQVLPNTTDELTKQKVGIQVDRIKTLQREALKATDKPTQDAYSAELLKAQKGLEDLIRRPQEQSVQSPKKSAAKEIIRIAKNGRRAVFDADTKEFIRYAD